ncbi:MAG: hypothetical protein LRY45_06530 [Bacteroides graminisolvens]|nr:hypothetical protein [Bacteroides graminisolvens]
MADNMPVWGGVGIALRSNSFLNLTNPAALTEIDSLKFTIEAGVMGAYKKIYSIRNRQ